MGIETILLVLLLVVVIAIGVGYLKSRKARGKPVSPGKEAERQRERPSARR